MSTYQLWVNISNKPKQNNWQQLDIGKEVIAMTFQANDIAELKDRFADRSNNIKLPCSANNNRVLQFAAQINSTTYVPYRKLPCRLLVDGIEIVGGGGGSLLISRISSHYECTIYGGTFNFFTAIKDLKLNQLSFNKNTYLWKSDVYENSLNENVLYPIMDWGAGIDAAAKTVDPRYLRPCVKLHHLLDTICANQGYKLLVDKTILKSQNYVNAAMPFEPNSGNEPVSRSYRGGVQTEASSSYPRSYMFQPNATVGGGNGFNYDSRNPDRLSFGYYPGGKKSFVFEVDIDVETLWNSPVEIMCFVGNSTKTKTFKNAQKETLTFFIDLLETSFSDTLEFMHIKLDFASQVVGRIKVDIRAKQTQDKGVLIKYGSSYNLPQSLPSLSQLDFFKGICQMYGFIVQANHQQREIYVYSYKSVYSRIMPDDKEMTYIFKDWSDKIDVSDKGQLSFKLDNYGQENIIKYKEYEVNDELKLTSEASFKIDDYTLEPSKTLFEMPFIALHDQQPFATAGIDLAIARLYPDPENSLPAHVVTIFEKEGAGISLNGYSSLNGYKIFGNFTSVQMQVLMNEHYFDLCNKMLKRAKITVEKFWFQPTDIMDFDHSIPIWLSKYNSFFYVNKIENYQQGKLTKVELVRM